MITKSLFQITEVDETRHSLSDDSPFCVNYRTTQTTVSGYQRIKIIKQSIDINTEELIKKLDSLKKEPTIVFPTSIEARKHLKSLM